MSIELKSVEFRREREDQWAELEVLLRQAEQKGLRNLTPDALSRLPILYRGAISSLSVARTITLDRNVLDYLENLVGRAYLAVYGTRHPLRHAVLRFLTHRFPSTVRRYYLDIVLALGWLLVGVLVGYMLTLADVENFYAFVSADQAQGRGPEASTQDLRAALYDREELADTLAAFASFLFSHNARIGILCFALGVAAGLPVVFLMLINGTSLGAFAALYTSRGLGTDFWGWVMPHGVTELGAMVLCAGAGFMLGRALVLPGRRTRLENLARTGSDAGIIVIGAVGMFFLAALIEGFFRQLVTDLQIRLSVMITTGFFWLVYFGFAGRGAVAQERETDR